MIRARTIRQPAMRRADFVAILLPWHGAILRPVAHAARDWLGTAYPTAPRTIGEGLAFAEYGQFLAAVESLSRAGFSLEVL